MNEFHPNAVAGMYVISSDDLEVSGPAEFLIHPDDRERLLAGESIAIAVRLRRFRPEPVFGNPKTDELEVDE